MEEDSDISDLSEFSSKRDDDEEVLYDVIV